MPALSFQDLIQTLNRYWAEQGCVLIQPLDTEVGAGTFHPATFLRALGPEPWRAAYVQPSRRPADGRYGQNPNRLQRYYQYQVVLKPSPDQIQEAFIAGQCQGWTSDKSQLAGVRSAFPDSEGGPEALMILEDPLWQVQLGPVVLEGDDEWAAAADRARVLATAR